jgi:DnaJ-class molecular chaperone
MSTKRDYYEILGVPKSAKLEQIRKAYREAALRYHPDRVPEAEKKSAEEKFKEISEAYAVLSDSQKRALYDQYGHSGIDQKYAYEDLFKGADFSSVFQDLSEFGFGENLFDQIFGDFSFDLSGKYRKTPSPFHHLQVTLDITLEEAAQGCEKKIPISYGEGGIKETHYIDVKIPPGVDTGSQLRVRGKGQSGQSDLYFVIEITPHPLFKRKGNDLYTHVTIPLTTAVLGGEYTVPTLFKNVVMKIPPGTQHGTQFRLRSKGMPILHQHSHGDEYITVKIEIPTRLTPEQRKLMEEFAKA